MGACSSPISMMMRAVFCRSMIPHTKQFGNFKLLFSLSVISQRKLNFFLTNLFNNYLATDFIFTFPPTKQW